MLIRRAGSVMLGLDVPVPYHRRPPNHLPGYQAAVGARSYHYALRRFTGSVWRRDEDGRPVGEPIPRSERRAA
jgi:hypothetical protein